MKLVPSRSRMALGFVPLGLDTDLSGWSAIDKAVEVTYTPAT